MFSDLAFFAAKAYHYITCRENKSDDLALSKLSENQQFVKRAYTAYENDICIESILRQIKKLESGLSAVIGNDQNLIEGSKLLYYSNMLNFQDKRLRDKCRAKNQYLDFLQGTRAEQIDIKFHDTDKIDFEIHE